MMGEAPPSHVYLSPHLDDVVLSCGGAVRRHRLAGEPVLVINILAADPPAKVSDFARVQHGYWGAPPQPMALRRAEDAAALALLTAEGRYLDYPDTVYRAAPSGAWLYDSEESLWADVHPADPMAQRGAEELADHLADLIPNDGPMVVYAPLGVGNHIDHQIVHTASRQLLSRGYRLAFYEEYPYAQHPNKLETALAAAGAGQYRAETIPLDVEDVMAKIAALAYYRTQLKILFGGAEAMRNLVWAFAATCSPEADLAERIWWPRKP